MRKTANVTLIVCTLGLLANAAALALDAIPAEAFAGWFAVLTLFGVLSIIGRHG